MKKYLLSLIIFNCLFNFQLFSVESEQINVLILSGKNNHEWLKTSPFIQKILESSGLFSVAITEEPDTLTSKSLQSFHTILSNWNSWPEKNCSWSETTKVAIRNFVQNGRGFVFVHAAGSANYDWPDYQNLAGAAWGNNTAHGKIASFQVKFSSSRHPVTKGLANFWTTDELWVNSKISGDPDVLAEAFAPVSNNGSDQMEPIIFCNKFGKGRSFSLLLGHDEQAMKNLGFQTLLLRATEWAASGKVNQAIPEQLNAKQPHTALKLSWKKEKHSLTLLNNKQIVWQYHFNPLEGKPYFHPLSTLDGTVLTSLRPDDHPWHRAVWFSWKYINGLNYWEEDHKTGKSEGITELKSSSQKTSTNGQAEFTHAISYHPPHCADILAETRSIKVYSPNPDGSYFMDWESIFTALADKVILDRTPLPDEPNGKSYGGYAGFSIRLNNQFWDVKAKNDNGATEQLHGKPSRWMSYKMKNLKGELASVTIFDHPGNLNHPNQWFIETKPEIPFYYFSPALLFGSKLILKKGEQLHLKYRLLVNVGELNRTQIKSNWNQFKNQ